MRLVDPSRIFNGIVLVVAPHMDDEVLACGGTLARLPDKAGVHFVYGSDGSQSPVSSFRRLGRDPDGLSQIRVEEAKAALEVLGVPAGNLHFLHFPDGQLNGHIDELVQLLAAIIDNLKPDHVVIPFRYDHHPDHLAVNHATLRALTLGNVRPEILEYFVYYRWRLLPGGDIRRFVRPELLVGVDIGPGSNLKRKALDCYRSQTTTYYDWQDRPILSRELLDEVCRGPELFVRFGASAFNTSVLRGGSVLVRAIQFIEPRLKRRKDQFLRSLRTGFERNGRE